MAFECNIDARGKAVRMKLGIRYGCQLKYIPNPSSDGFSNEITQDHRP